MGNFRSGGHNCTHGQYESSYRVDSFELAKYTSQYCGLSYSWTGGGVPAGSINIIHKEKHFLFCYTWNRTEKIKRQVDYTTVANNYGGSRTYFLCPRCSKRIRFLCSNGKEFTCRKCAGVNYKIQQISHSDKPMYYINKLLKALKVNTTGMNNFDKARFQIYFKPKYMRQEKFDSLRQQLLWQQRLFWDDAARRIYM